MKNVTIVLDERTAAWPRIQAAKQNLSVSRRVGQMLSKQMTGAQAYDESMRRFLNEEPLEFGWVGGRRPAREELHDRDALRRY
ncbi:MAG: CopG family transcriptional regulator [Steroidobacteraceae bacterium]